MTFTAIALITQRPLESVRHFVNCIKSKTRGKSHGFLGNTQVQRYRSWIFCSFLVVNQIGVQVIEVPVYKLDLLLLSNHLL